jgi:two-component system response regulator HydG
LSKRLKIPRLTLDATCLDHLHAYPWPGNARELENALERAAVVSEDGRIRPENLPPGMRQPGTGRPLPGGERPTLADLERRHILAVLDETGGNRTRAARILGISTTTLWRKLKALK